MGDPQLQPELELHRDPLSPLSAPENLESPEYINIILELLLYYPTARAAGMPAPRGEELRAARAVVTRALSAYWTHSGYLNWDTGLYRLRWHLGRYWGFALQGLFAIAQSEELRGDAEGAWAKWMFDRALATYLRLALAEGPNDRIPQTPLFNVKTTFFTQPSDFAARFLLHATRAVYYGFANRPAEQPPPLYAFDPFIGRLAVTTPTYNTAVVSVSNRAFPYGGLELARLFDADQRIVAGVGGYGAAGFGAIVRDAGGTILETQRPRARVGLPSPITVTRSPRGRVRGTVSYPAQPYAGAFETLQYTGTARAAQARVQVAHTFQSDRILCAWTFTRTARDELSAEVRFPSWGDGATITAVLRVGGPLALTTGTRRRLAGVERLVVRSGQGQSGYAVVPRSFPSGAVVTLATVAAQTSNPDPGPSLVVQLAPLSAWRQLALEVELLPGDLATS